MTFHFSKVSILLLAFLAIGCQNKSQDDPSIKSLSFDLNKAQKEVKFEDVISEVRYVPLHENEHINTISDIIITKNQAICIVDKFTRRVHFFSQQGLHITSLDGIGRGPEEFVYFAGVAYDERADEIFIYDPPTKKMLIYAPEGTLKRTLRVPEEFNGGSFFVIRDQYILFNENMYPGKGVDHYVQVYDKETLQPIKKIFPVLEDPTSLTFPTTLKQSKHATLITPQNSYRFLEYKNLEDYKITSINFGAHQPSIELSKQRNQLEVPQVEEFDKFYPFVFTYFNLLKTDDHWMLQCILQSRHFWIIHHQKTNKSLIFETTTSDQPHLILPDQVFSTHGNEIVGVYSKLNKLKKINQHLGKVVQDEDLTPIVVFFTLK